MIVTPRLGTGRCRILVIGRPDDSARLRPRHGRRAISSTSKHGELQVLISSGK